MQFNPAISFDLPKDNSRFNYTYYGKSILGRSRDINSLDSLRSKPSLVIGSTGCGKTEGMLTRCYQDAMKGRPVLFIDGKCEKKTWDKLYYYNHVIAGRPFYTLFPLSSLDRYSMSWNPLHSTTLEISTVIEAFFNTYKKYGNNKGDGSYYTDMQRIVFTDLCRALHASGWGFNLEDITVLLEDYAILDSLASKIRPEGMRHYSRVIGLRNQEKDFIGHMRGFLNHLKLFDHWTLNSYNPDLQLDRLYYTDATIYIGLPVNSQKIAMSTIGNILINQLMALSNHIQSSCDEPNRRNFSVFIDEAGSFIDEGIADWICKVRTSGFTLELGIQTLADLERVRPGLGRQIRGNAPNLCLFNPQDIDTAKWFSDMAGEEDVIVRNSTVDGGEETGKTTEKIGEIPKVHPNLINQLRTGQFLYRPSERVYRPILMASAMLPPAPPTPDCQWHGQHFDEKKAEVRGLFMKQQLDAVRRQPSKLKDEKKPTKRFARKKK